MYTRLTEIPSYIAVYLPFHDAAAETSPVTAGQGNNAILLDASVNCYHLTPLFGAVASEAPVGHDSPCVKHTLNAIPGRPRGVTTYAGPSVAEYGGVQVSASGFVEGSFKRAYSYIEDNGKWCLVTGFRIGALKTEARRQPSNTGLALVKSEVADLFALRLQMRGPIAPVVAYQMRPNPDIPKDRNLVSFEINRAYTKQGCLDGRRNLTNDPDCPVMSSAPKDASYYKPVEAYALHERIRRAEEQRQGELDRHSLLLYSKGESLPQRTHRNICNSYVWTADGGTFQETNSTLDMVQSEVGGNLNTKISVGASFDMELAFGNSLGTVDVDAMYSAHFNFNMTKEKTSDEGFELDAQPPPSVDIRYKDPKTGKYVKRPGAVDAFRWMSFWLEPSVEATDTLFEQVIDPIWLEESPESNAQLLRSLREALAKETGNARTKAWKVLHRCTYVSRVPEKVEQRPAALGNVQDEKKSTSTLLADVACNWLLIQKLEPFARGAESKAQLATVLKSHVTKLFPSLITQTRLYVHVLNLVADYIGLA
ncbi:hypothetical protein CEP52_013439 [Fusarium oligoseptatum]|uniref:MACPF domain-containing protein n=1 Tax=Fusarium oligoseptatum TaxID=2604345 RepID=A0A428STM0_9HYPO|nr:hypothetical protein CEP52_013439 [Fusarium oligoseptatum]